MTETSKMETARRAGRRRLSGGASLNPPPDEDAQQETWMMTYMDTVTLLVTLFVLMLSFSAVDTEKYNAIAEGLDLSKYGRGIMSGTMGIAPDPGVSSVVLDVPGLLPAERIALDTAREDEASDLAERLSSQLETAGIQELVGVSVLENTLTMELNEKVLFASSRADLSSQGKGIVDQIAPLLRSGDFRISVEGHTDDLPINTTYFPSNWELSGARAASVARQLIAQGVDRTRLRIVGYADTRPTVENADDQSRQRNRRVSIELLFPDERAGGS